MNTPAPDCPACLVQMQEGFIPDMDHGRIRRLKWTEGRPETSILQNVKVKGRLQLDTVTFRCPKCGWLIWFAPSPPSGD